MKMKFKNVALSLALLSLGIGGCYDESSSDYPTEVVHVNQLSIEKAQTVFATQVSQIPVSRVIETAVSTTSFSPGIVTPDWSKAKLNLEDDKSYVNVPICTSKSFSVYSPLVKDWVRMSQRLLVIQNDITLVNSLYLVYIVPEEVAIRDHQEQVADYYDGNGMNGNFTGTLIYTLLQESSPVYVAHYENGQLKEEASILDENTMENNIGKSIEEALEGYSLRLTSTILSSEYPESDEGDDNDSDLDFIDDSWSEGNGWSVEIGDGLFTLRWEKTTINGTKVWIVKGEDGKYYYAIDTDEDDKADTIIGEVI